MIFEKNSCFSVIVLQMLLIAVLHSFVVNADTTNVNVCNDLRIQGPSTDDILSNYNGYLTSPNQFFSSQEIVDVINATKEASESGNVTYNVRACQVVVNDSPLFQMVNLCGIDATNTIILCGTTVTYLGEVCQSAELCSQDDSLSNPAFTADCPNISSTFSDCKVKCISPNPTYEEGLSMCYNNAPSSQTPAMVPTQAPTKTKSDAMNSLGSHLFLTAATVMLSSYWMVMTVM